MPGVPTGVSATAGDGTLAVGWTAPVDDGGSTLSGYKVRHCDDSTGCDVGSEWTVIALSGTGTSTTVAGLTNGTEYQVQVAATNAQGDSGWSESVTQTPSTVPGVPTGVEVSRGAGSLSVSWTAPGDGGSAITVYTVQYCNDDDTDCGVGDWDYEEVSGSEVSGSEVSKLITGLADDTTFQVQVRATNAVGHSGWSDAESATTFAKPGVPTQLELPINDLTITARWKAPTDDGGSPITGYKLQHCVAGTEADGCDTNGWTLITTSGTRTRHMISGLAANTTYQVQVAATNDAGDSGWSESRSARTADVPGVLIRPAVRVSGLSFLVSWSAPRDDGGSEVTGYKVRYCVDPTGCDSLEWTVSTLVGPDTYTTITGLLANTTYQVQVAATNNIGDSDWSLSTTQTTGTSLSAAAASVTVGWTAPADGAVAADN